MHAKRTAHTHMLSAQSSHKSGFVLNFSWLAVVPIWMTNEHDKIHLTHTQTHTRIHWPNQNEPLNTFCKASNQCHTVHHIFIFIPKHMHACYSYCVLPRRIISDSKFFCIRSPSWTAFNRHIFDKLFISRGPPLAGLTWSLCSIRDHDESDDASQGSPNIDWYSNETSSTFFVNKLTFNGHELHARKKELPQNSNYFLCIANFQFGFVPFPMNSTIFKLIEIHFNNFFSLALNSFRFQLNAVEKSHKIGPCPCLDIALSNYIIESVIVSANEEQDENRKTNH